jgi:hypothetical protein
MARKKATPAFVEFVPREKTVLRNNLMPSSVLVDEPEFNSFGEGLVEHEDKYEDSLDPQDAPTRGWYQHGARPYRPSRLQ